MVLIIVTVIYFNFKINDNGWGRFLPLLNIGLLRITSTHDDGERKVVL
jgi:hypothetical protein